MKTIEQKKEYVSPFIECVKLDNEISLALESMPGDPGEPGIILGQAPEHFNNNPFNA